MYVTKIKQQIETGRFVMLSLKPFKITVVKINGMKKLHDRDNEKYGSVHFFSRICMFKP